MSATEQRGAGLAEEQRRAALEAAHALVGRTCESWRRSLLVDGPTDHLHHIECVRVAGLAAEHAEMLALLKCLEWRTHYGGDDTPLETCGVCGGCMRHRDGCEMRALLARLEPKEPAHG